MAKSPNAPYEPGESQQQRQSRWEYKLCFQRLLSMRIRRLLAAGQHVILAGDLNVARCAVHVCCDFWQITNRPLRER
jgi:exonuclease III